MRYVRLVLSLLGILCSTVVVAAPISKGMHPIIDATVIYLLGGTAQGKWLDANKMGPLVKNGEQYHLYSLTKKLGVVTGSKPVDPSIEDGGGCAYTLDLQSRPNSSGTVIGIAGNWDALLRIPKVQSVEQAAYKEAARVILKAHGLSSAQPRLTQVLRIDLDGNSQEEVLFSATAANPALREIYSAKKDYYSFVALRRVVGGKVATSVLDGEFYSKASDPSKGILPASYQVSALLDADGDGTQEIFVSSTDLKDGGATSIFKLGRSGVEKVLSEGYGN